MKNFRKLILLVLVLLMLLPIFAGCGTDSDETLSISVLSISDTDNGKKILFLTNNQAGYNVSLGWVGSCQIEVTTTEGTYYYEPFMTEIPRGRDLLEITVPRCTGKVEKIVFTDLRLLDNGGNLPGSQMRNVVVFDASKDIESFTGTFSPFTNSSFLVGLFAIIVAALPVLLILSAIAIVVLLTAIVVILILRHGKKTKSASHTAAKPAASDPDDGFAPPPMPNN